MNRTAPLTLLFCLLLAATGCKYTTQLSTRDKALDKFTELLDKADTLPDARKISFFMTGLKGTISGKKGRLDNARVLRDLSNTRRRSDTTAAFLTAICSNGFFLRRFDMDPPTEMFYRFEAPNNQGLGKMYLSDRYRDGFFDEQMAMNNKYIDSFNYTFPRIYFIRSNELHILSSDCDLTDRKVFKRLKVESDTIFTKTSTYRKNNNDEVYDISYSFRYVRSHELSDRWRSIAVMCEDSNLVTKDKVNYISFPALKEIISENKASASQFCINLTDTTYRGHWFYAGTINALGEWESNYTTIESVKSIDSYVEDTTKSFEVRTMVYIRQSPPGDYTADKTLQEHKGEINNSLEPKQKIHITDQRRVTDNKGNFSLWLRIGEVEGR